ncbi:Pyrimidine nucleotide transporter, mitochondrial [Malassezia cuniculi]|uniref:Pyrimidine nucleotide transporter, mitochondrial n=1 Tax=Malassezia cuniculi TaxID=948313 RepID=A0AAF0J6R9_9BASI|nr:Pyrimidine nucleotide transporter, mitochondrial [Malassezia cuniculi]
MLQAPGQDATRERASKVPPGWLHFAAGGVGGMCGAVITSPFDVVKTRLQSDMYKTAHKKPNRPAVLGMIESGARHFVETCRMLAEISAREGTSALFKGLGPTLVGVIPARAINFATYGTCKRFYSETFDHSAGSPLVHLAAAATAGITTATATNPIWVVKTRLQLESQRLEADARSARVNAVGQKNVRGLHTSARVLANMQFVRAAAPPHPATSAFRMAATIVRTEGVAGLYKGLTASYLGVSESTIQWVLYERLKRLNEKQESTQVPAVVRTIGAAGCAKMVATLVTYPHEVLRTRMRQQPVGQPKYTGLVQTFRLVLREEGPAAFYGGFTAHLMRVIPNAIVTFSIFEFVLALGSHL